MSRPKGRAGELYDELKEIKGRYPVSDWDFVIKAINRERVDSDRDEREDVPWKETRKMATRQKWICGICRDYEKPMSRVQGLTVCDHIDPSRIDFNAKDNLQAAHKSCNALKSSSNPYKTKKMIATGRFQRLNEQGTEENDHGE